jgi:hypothetical protein
MLYVQIILQTQHQSSLLPEERYKGLRDALSRIPEREGGWRVGCLLKLPSRVPAASQQPGHQMMPDDDC